jgi:hypothetical protein
MDDDLVPGDRDIGVVGGLPLLLRGREHQDGFGLGDRRLRAAGWLPALDGGLVGGDGFGAAVEPRVGQAG